MPEVIRKPIEPAKDSGENPRSATTSTSATPATSAAPSPAPTLNSQDDKVCYENPFITFVF